MKVCVYYIVGRLNADDYEEIDSTTDREDAHYMLVEYKKAFGPTWDLWIDAKRVS